MHLLAKIKNWRKRAPAQVEPEAGDDLTPIELAPAAAPPFGDPRPARTPGTAGASGTAGDAARSPMPARRRPASWDGEHCAVLRTDVTGFSAQHRTEQDHKSIRKAMYAILRRAFEAVDLSLDDCDYEDRGDGTLTVVPPWVPTKRIIDRLFAHVGDELSRHNARAAESIRFQLRCALDVGPVESDDEGLSGQVIIRTARLVDAPPFKKRLAADPTRDAGFIVSEHVYNDVIWQHPAELNPDRYQKITWRVKGRRYTGWIRLAPEPAPEQPPSDPAADEPASP